MRNEHSPRDLRSFFHSLYVWFRWANQETPQGDLIRNPCVRSLIVKVIMSLDEFPLEEKWKEEKNEKLMNENEEEIFRRKRGWKYSVKEYGKKMVGTKKEFVTDSLLY